MTLSSSQARRGIAVPLASDITSGRTVTGSILFLLAGLAALGALATNIILPAFPLMGAELAISSAELGLLLSSFSHANPTQRKKRSL